jgi:hypothetical protein
MQKHFVLQFVPGNPPFFHNLTPLRVPGASTVVLGRKLKSLKLATLAGCVTRGPGLTWVLRGYPF